MNISVLGCGRWGSFIAWYLSKNHKVILWGRPESKNVERLIKERKNDVISFNENTLITTDLDKALENDIIVISISGQELRGFAGSLSKKINTKKTFVLCMKGLENSTGKRLTEVFREGYGKDMNLAVWLGPGHVEDFAKGIPNCMVIDSESDEVKHFLADSFSSNTIRFYYGTDLIGNEIGGASKNVIGIAAGMLDGLGLSSLKGALMARGASEISRLIGKMGGNPMSAYGLCHLGDYEATVFSAHSHNRAFGEAFIRGEDYKYLAEGYETSKALYKLSKDYDIELPISNAVYSILFENKDPKETLNTLFDRKMKSEF